jgi:histone deacetylase 1/2
LYGLKQAPRAWYQRFASFIQQLGFVASTSDISLFVLREGGSLAYLLLYVDDIILTASSSTLLQQIMAKLSSEFAMTDLGDLHHFLGISVTRSSDGLFLSQRQYAVDILQRAGMAECHSTATPVDTQAELLASDGAPLSASDSSTYRSLVGALQYLTLTRPDLAYAVQQVCLFMHDPREPHLALVKRILRYVKGTLSSGLHIGTGPVDSLTGYSDADWAGCPDSRRSTSGFCVFLSDNPISWSSKRQTTVSQSSAEAEYRAVAHVVAECCWIRQLLQELHVPLSSATVVYCDNVSAVYMMANPVHHRRTKHIEIDIHFVREKVALGQVRVLHVPSTHPFADIMTKGLPVQLFTDFRSSLCVRSPPAATAGGY